MDDAVRGHCAEIDRCNQRGGRMLSIVDLVEAGTITPELAAYAMAAIGDGASFLIGALPGGAGKTTIMGALLNFVPVDVALRPADSLDTIRQGIATPTPRCCYVCHEIGSGPYYSYLWDEELRAYFDLPGANHMIATNLHADTFAQAKAQICDDNGVAPEALRRMNLMLFLEVSRRVVGVRRRVVSAWESDGAGEHRQICVADGKGEVMGGSLVGAGAVARARAILDAMIADRVRDIRRVRERIIQAD
jgi:hypothetical protein